MGAQGHTQVGHIHYLMGHQSSPLTKSLESHRIKGRGKGVKPQTNPNMPQTEKRGVQGEHSQAAEAEAGAVTEEKLRCLCIFESSAEYH